LPAEFAIVSAVCMLTAPVALVAGT
jgi:hypothetical protein